MAIDETKIVDELSEEYKIEELVSFDEINIQEKIQQNPYQLMKFQDMAIKEKMKYEELEELLERLVGKLYHEYRFNHPEELSNKEIEKYYIPTNIKYIKMKEILRKQKIRILFFEQCIKGIDRQYWAMRDFCNKRI
ncbi:MAG: hypothetical protein RBS24_07000 [Bacilli bacterium]|nr:hypothetical protein [Bacilli bacterium]